MFKHMVMIVIPPDRCRIRTPRKLQYPGITIRKGVPNFAVVSELLQYTPLKISFVRANTRGGWSSGGSLTYSGNYELGVSKFLHTAPAYDFYYEPGLLPDGINVAPVRSRYVRHSS